MKLSECTYGRLVYSEKYGVGMVVGITNCCPGADATTRREVERAIPVIQWASGETSQIHQRNIEIFEE